MSYPVSAAEVQYNFIVNNCYVSATALLVYEHLITFDREYRLVWKRRFSAATLLFLLARYPLLLSYILYLPTSLPSDHPLSTIYSVLSYLVNILQALFIFLVVPFTSLRAYALSGRQWPITSLILILSLVSFGLNMFSNYRQVAISAELWYMLSYAPCVATITAEILVVAVTIHSTYWQRRAAAEADLQTPLHTVILRDGMVYFLAILMTNIISILSIYPELASGSFIYINQLTYPIQTIIMSRFILNLRDVDASQRGTEDASRPSFVGSIQFAAFVEPLGAPLDHELSFSAIDVTSLDEEGADGENENQDVLGDDEEMVSAQASIHEPSEAEAGPSRVRE